MSNYVKTYGMKSVWKGQENGKDTCNNLILLSKTLFLLFPLSEMPAHIPLPIYLGLNSSVLIEISFIENNLTSMKSYISVSGCKKLSFFN